MPSTNKTPMGLNQWAETDKPARLDFNQDNITINNFFRGCIFPFGGSTPPAGSLLCDGSAVSRTTYANLFAVIGTNYGAGDGSTTFNLPNLRHRVPAGYDASDNNFNALGKTGGEDTHILTVNEMPTHHHLQNMGAAWSNVANSTGSGVISNANSSNTGDTGGGAAHNNLQPYTTVNYIIVY